MERKEPGTGAKRSKSGGAGGERRRSEGARESGTEDRERGGVGVDRIGGSVS